MLHTEHLLVCNDLHLRVSSFGAGIRGMWQDKDRGERSVIITEYPGTENNVGSQGDVLMPFPSRIPDGRYTFDGQSFQLALNDAPRRHAMHGFLRSAVWDVTSLSDTEITFFICVGEADFPGYPFAVRISVTYRLGHDGLRCDFTAENIGAGPAPFGAGFHPYFSVGSATVDADVLQVPHQQLFIAGNPETVAGTPWDFRTPQPVGSKQFDAVYTKPLRDSDGRARVRYTSPDARRTVTVWMDETFEYVVLYSGDTLPPSHQRFALAIEPWTCAPNAFNYPERGLTILAPGDLVRGSWGVTPG